MLLASGDEEILGGAALRALPIEATSTVRLAADL
jgi:hypothetical protein